jgi:hypothetical protein
MSKSKTTKKDEVESTVAFNQVKKVVLYEQVAKQMKAAILGGSYQPGDRLPHGKGVVHHLWRGKAHHPGGP